MKTLEVKKSVNYIPDLGRKAIANQKDAIQHFIHKMDIEMIDAFLDDDKTYQDYEKSVFIAKMKFVFERFESFGDRFLLPIAGRCAVCDKTKTGFSFYGNISKNYINIIFDREDNKINDLYDCSSFQNVENDVKLNEQIFFD